MSLRVATVAKGTGPVGYIRRLCQADPVGLKDLRRRLTASVEELDAVRLHDRYSGLGVTEIAEMPTRVPVRVGGEVQRLRVVPRAGSASTEAVLSDGTGEVVVVFTGRRAIGGLHPGRGVLVEGVAHNERGRPGDPEPRLHAAGLRAARLGAVAGQNRPDALF